MGARRCGVWAGEVGDRGFRCGDGCIAGWFTVGPSPHGSLTFATMDDVTAIHHVVDCGFFLMLWVSVLAGGAGVVGIGAKTM